MAFKNFVPSIWSIGIERELEKALVFAEDCNRKYEGEVKKMGDSVRILGVGRPTIITTTDSEIKLSGPEVVDDTSVVLPIKQISYYNFKVDDIDTRQSQGSLLDALTGESSYGIANAMDTHIASMAACREAIKLSKAPIVLTKDNVLAEIDKAIENLYLNDVRPNSDIVLTVPPWFYMLLKQAYTALDTDNSKILENGKVGKYGNVSVKMSNNVYKDENGASLVMLRTKNAIAFANPHTVAEAYRPQNEFSDAVKGFSLYQAKIVRPKELVVLNVKPN